MNRTYLCTLNNPDVDPAEYLEAWYLKAGALYVIGQLEKGAEGTIHIQYALWFKTPVRISKLKKHCSRSHFEPVKQDNGVGPYCMKEDTRLDGPWEHGTKPVKRNSKEDWEEVKTHAVKGDLDKIPAEIFIKHYANLKMIKKDYMTHDRSGEAVDARWYYGKTGVGKSRQAWTEFPEAFPKQVNKWWDGYQDHEHVIMDDMDPFNKALGGDIKRWADRYKITGETKGGAVPLKIKVFIITSQYAPEDIWTDPETISAIRRRFKVTHFKALGGGPEAQLGAGDLQGPLLGIIAGDPIVQNKKGFRG